MNSGTLRHGNKKQKFAILTNKKNPILTKILPPQAKKEKKIVVYYYLFYRSERRKCGETLGAACNLKLFLLSHRQENQIIKKHSQKNQSIIFIKVFSRKIEV